MSEKNVLFDRRMGRYFSLINMDSKGPEELISFTRHTALQEIGRKKLALNVFYRKGLPEKPEWEIVQARNLRGEHYKFNAGDGALDILCGGDGRRICPIFQRIDAAPGGEMKKRGHVWLIPGTKTIVPSATMNR